MHMCVCIYVCVCVCIYVCDCACVHAYMRACMYTHLLLADILVCVSVSYFILASFGHTVRLVGGQHLVIRGSL